MQALWLMIVAVIVVTTPGLSGARQYEDRYYREECDAKSSRPDTFKAGPVIRMYFTKSPTGTTLTNVEPGKSSCQFDITFNSAKIAYHLMGCKTLPQDELWANIRKYLPVDNSKRLTLEIMEGQKTSEKLKITTSKAESPRNVIEPRPEPMSKISFKWSGDYIHNTFVVPEWRLVYMIWGVKDDIIEDMDEVSKNSSTIRLRKSCGKTFRPLITDPVRSYMHHHENPLDMIDISDCEVEIIAPNETYALNYYITDDYNASDVYQYMLKETLTMSYKLTARSDYKVFRTYNDNTTKPMIDLPIPNNTIGVYAIKYKFATNGEKKAILAALVFQVGTIINPIDMSDISTEPTPTDPPSTTKAPETPTPTPTTPPPTHTTRPLITQAVRLIETIGGFDGNVILYVFVALLAFVAIVSLAAYMSTLNKWRPNFTRHDTVRCDMSNRHDHAVYTNESIELKTREIMDKHP